MALRSIAWTRLVQPAPPAPPTGSSHPQPLQKLPPVRVEFGALVHSLIAIAGGLLLVFAGAPTWRFWLWPELWFTGTAAETTPGQALLFGTGAVYFLVDSVFLAAHTPGGLPRGVVLGYMAHHACCALGLLAPIVWGRDAPIALLGYLLGELSNPARVLAQLSLVYGGRPELVEVLDRVHLAGFLLLRALSCKLAFDVFWGAAELRTTQAVMASLAFLSGLAIAYHFFASEGCQQPPPRERKHD